MPTPLRSSVSHFLIGITSLTHAHSPQTPSTSDSFLFPMTDYLGSVYTQKVVTND